MLLHNRWTGLFEETDLVSAGIPQDETRSVRDLHPFIGSRPAGGLELGVGILEIVHRPDLDHAGSLPMIRQQHERAITEANRGNLSAEPFGAPHQFASELIAIEDEIAADVARALIEIHEAPLLRRHPWSVSVGRRGRPGYGEAMPTGPAARSWNGIDIPAPGPWAIDPDRSRVEFVIRYLVSSRVRGRFQKFSGIIEVAERPEDTRLEVEIDAGSVQTRIRPLDRLLRSRRFLDPARFPILRFRSTRLQLIGDTRFQLPGEFTVRDVSRSVMLDVQFLGLHADPTVARFRGIAEIDRTDFGITWHRLLEIRGWLVRRRVRVELDIEASLLPESEGRP
jgi:polyisoprenoid-binding protein YceI